MDDKRLKRHRDNVRRMKQERRSTIRTLVMAKFETKEQYMQWCEDMVTKIYYANIAMNNEGIKEAVSQIASKLHIPEGECLYDGGEIGSKGINEE